MVHVLRRWEACWLEGSWSEDSVVGSQTPDPYLPEYINPAERDRGTLLRLIP